MICRTSKSYPASPPHIAANALPLIRQHAFEAHLTRTLRSIDAEGLLDVRTGLLTAPAFNRDFATAIYQTLSRGGGLTVARFAFDPAHPRAQFDGARIISRLMRQMDFGAAQHDGSVIVAFADTDLRNGHLIARRLSSVMRHTSHGKRDARSEPAVTVATMMPTIRRSRCWRGYTTKRAARRRNRFKFELRNDRTALALLASNLQWRNHHEEDCTDIDRVAGDAARCAFARRTPRRPPALCLPPPSSRRCRRTQMSSSKLKGLKMS